MDRHVLTEALPMAIGTLRANKLRSSLTILGIVIGVATVIGMVAVINGMRANVSTLIEELGSSVVYVYRFKPQVTLGRPPSEILQRKEITYEDAVAIQRSCPSVQAVSPGLRYFDERRGAGVVELKWQNERVRGVVVQGSIAAEERIGSIQIDQGRFINETDNEHSRTVCVVGSKTAEGLFHQLDPIGKEIMLGDKRLTVIGVLVKRQGKFGFVEGGDENILIIPLRTFNRFYPEIRDHWVSVKPVSQEAMPKAIDEITELLRRRRRVAADAPDNFGVFTQDTISDLWNQLTGAISLVMIVISSIGLLVGGVGVMNIMLVTVTERTREIGVRKAIGARRRDIMWQFLFEAMILTAIGGIMGVLAGGSISLLVSTLSPLPSSVSLWSVGLGLAVSIGIGLFFGLYPARRAARLDPIESLRYE